MRDIVVMGGSAGSAHALARILSALPKDFPAAVIARVDAALDDTAAPQKTAWLHTPMPCRSASEGMQCIAGSLLVLPTDARGVLTPDGLISLKGAARLDDAARPIDALFASAAAAFGRRVIGVVLSGGDADGTAGLKAIEARGGLGIVQSPVDARDPRAPSHAVAADHPDCVAMLDDIPRLLMHWTRSN